MDLSSDILFPNEELSDFGKLRKSSKMKIGFKPQDQTVTASEDTKCVEDLVL